MDHRPERIRIIHELGKPQSLMTGADQFEQYGSGDDILLLGLGPDPAEAVTAIAAHAADSTVHYIECPDFARQMPPAWTAAIPAHWHMLTPHECSRKRFAQSRTFFYRPNGRLFPSFWGPLLAAAQWQHLRPRTHTPERPLARTVLLAGTEHSLLLKELQNAFTAEGFIPHTVEPDAMAAQLPHLLAKAPPALFVSVNFQGLDMFGERYHLLRAAGVQVAVWCVDTPWHILSGCKAPFWKDLHLFVTDDTFIPALQAAGATQVSHLPLATDPDIFNVTPPTTQKEYSYLSRSVVFVGRSEFPARDKYFSGIVPDPALLDEAKRMLARGERPDYHWWSSRCNEDRFWPETPRHIGAGAEATSRYWRSLCLQQSVPCDLTVFGDAAWKSIVPDLHDLRPPVDYYTEVRSIYHHAAISLNITGLLLPGGLTQRHFDVWAAGGLLLTDANPGLHIFPSHLTDAITFRRATDLPAKIDHLRVNPHFAGQLRATWREHILTHHTYRHRIQTILSKIFLDATP